MVFYKRCLYDYMDDIKDLTEYFDLTNKDISDLSIVETSNQFNCMLIDQQIRNIIQE